MNKYDPFDGAGCWYFYFVYFNPKDPRVIVSKRQNHLGWTLNLARPMAIPSLLLMIAFMLAPSAVFSHYGIQPNGIYALTMIAEIVALIAFCSWRANPARYLDKHANQCGDSL